MADEQEHLDEFIIRDPEGFARRERLFPIAAASVLVTYGMFVVISLVGVVIGREAAMPILKASIVLFALAGFLQTAFYLIRRDASTLCMIGTCAFMLVAQTLYVLSPGETLGAFLFFTALWAFCLGASLYLAWKGMTLAKRDAEAAQKRWRDIQRNLRL